MKQWTNPQITVEEYVANDYVAACGQSGKTYVFNCSIPAGTTVYRESNGIEGLQRGLGSQDDEISTYQIIFNHNDKITVESSAVSSLQKGYTVQTLGSNETIKDVLIWTDGRGNKHVISNTNQSTWETGKS